MINSKTLKEESEKLPTKELRDSVFAHALEWECLEKRCSKLFKIGHVENFGDLILECPNQAFADSLTKNWDIKCVEKEKKND